MTPARRLWKDAYDSPIVRHRWVFVAFVVLWTVMVVLEIGNVIRLIRNHVPFGVSFWVGTAMLVFLATILIRASRLRRSAAALSQSRC